MLLELVSAQIIEQKLSKLTIERDNSATIAQAAHRVVVQRLAPVSTRSVVSIMISMSCVVVVNHRAAARLRDDEA